VHSETQTTKLARDMINIEAMKKDLETQALELQHKYALKKDKYRERKIDLEMKELEVAQKASPPKGQVVISAAELEDLERIESTL
jgi:hypothetical protein